MISFSEDFLILVGSFVLFFLLINLYVFFSNLKIVAHTFLNTFNYSAPYAKGEFLIFLPQSIWLCFFFYNAPIDFLFPLFILYILLALISMFFRSIFNYTLYSESQNNSPMIGCIALIILVVIYWLIGMFRNGTFY